MKRCVDSRKRSAGLRSSTAAHEENRRRRPRQSASVANALFCAPTAEKPAASATTMKPMFYNHNRSEISSNFYAFVSNLPFSTSFRPYAGELVNISLEKLFATPISILGTYQTPDHIGNYLWANYIVLFHKIVISTDRSTLQLLYLSVPVGR